MKREREPTRVFIVDDSPAVREALRWALDEAADMVVVGAAGDGATAMHRISALQPDIVLLDIELPDSDGYIVARHLKAQPHPPQVIFLSVHEDDVTQQRARAAGGDAFVEKSVGWPPLIQQIRQLRPDTEDE